MWRFWRRRSESEGFLARTVGNRRAAETVLDGACFAAEYDGEPSRKGLEVPLTLHEEKVEDLGAAHSDVADVRLGFEA